MSDGKKKKTSVYATIALVLIVVAVILTMLFSLNGETVYTSSDGDAEVVYSLACESDKVVYPFSAKDGAERRNLKIKAIFENDKLRTISLVYKVYSDDDSEIQRIGVDNRVVVNQFFAEDNLPADALGVTFSSLNDSAQISFYANANEVNSSSARYFLLDGMNGAYKRNAVARRYNEKGLDCVTKH